MFKWRGTARKRFSSPKMKIYRFRLYLRYAAHSFKCQWTASKQTTCKYSCCWYFPRNFNPNSKHKWYVDLVQNKRRGSQSTQPTPHTKKGNKELVLTSRSTDDLQACSQETHSSWVCHCEATIWATCLNIYVEHYLLNLLKLNHIPNCLTQLIANLFGMIPQANGLIIVLD